MNELLPNPAMSVIHLCATDEKAKYGTFKINSALQET